MTGATLQVRSRENLAPGTFRYATANSSASKKKFAIGVAWSETVAEAAPDVSKDLVARDHE